MFAHPVRPGFTTCEYGMVLRSVASVCVSVCLSVCPVWSLNFLKLRPRNFVFGTGMQVLLKNIQFPSVYHRIFVYSLIYKVKVKVTGAKSTSVCPVRGWSAFQ